MPMVSAPCRHRQLLWEYVWEKHIQNRRQSKKPQHRQSKTLNDHEDDTPLDCRQSGMWHSIGTSMPYGTTKKEEVASQLTAKSWVVRTGTAIGQSATFSVSNKQHINRGNRPKGLRDLKKPSHQHARPLSSVSCDSE